MRSGGNSQESVLQRGESGEIVSPRRLPLPTGPKAEVDGTVFERVVVLREHSADRIAREQVTACVPDHVGDDHVFGMGPGGRSQWAEMRSCPPACRDGSDHKIRSATIRMFRDTPPYRHPLAALPDCRDYSGLVKRGNTEFFKTAEISATLNYDCRRHRFARRCRFCGD